MVFCFVCFYQLFLYVLKVQVKVLYFLILLMCEHQAIL